MTTRFGAVTDDKRESGSGRRLEYGEHRQFRFEGVPCARPQGATQMRRLFPYKDGERADIVTDDLGHRTRNVTSGVEVDLVERTVLHGLSPPVRTRASFQTRDIREAGVDDTRLSLGKRVKVIGSGSRAGLPCILPGCVTSR